LYSNFFLQYLTKSRGRDSIVGIATCYGLEDRGVGVRVSVGVKNFLFFASSRRAMSSFPGVKLQVREADHSPPTSAMSRKCESIHPLPHTPSLHSA
jgi:hypothetical protein